jgi:HK97 family phage major capsid protein
MGAEVKEVTLDSVKTAIDDSNRLFQNEFRETNEKIKALQEAGKAIDPLLTEKLAKINEALDKHAAANEALIAFRTNQEKVNKAFADFQADVQRKRIEDAGGSDGVSKRAAAIQSHNRSLRALAVAAGRSIGADMDGDALDAYVSAFSNYLRRGDRHLTEIERRALSVGVDTEGGYLVTPDLSGRMVTRIYETSPMRQYASAQTIATDALEGSADLDEATVGWVGETGTRSDSTTPQVPAPWRIPVHEAYSMPKATQKLLEDANIDVAAWLAKKNGDKFGRVFNTAFVTGNGIAKPRGFASYTTAATADASRAWGVFEHIATGTNGSFGTDPNGINKLLLLIHAMKDVYVAKGAFYMNRTTLGAARTITDASSAGKYVFIPSFVAGMPDTFLGYPVRKLQDMATYSTTDALALAFGDMEETYQIVDRLGITTLVDPYTAKPYVVFYTRARIGGDVVNFESMKFLKFGTS